MASTIRQIREALASSLVNLSALQVSAYPLGNPTPPAAHVMPSEIVYDQAMHRGVDRIEFIVQIFSALGLSEGAQMKLDRMLEPSGANSIKAAIEADRTLGGVVRDCVVRGVDNFQIVTLENQRQFVAANMTVTVLA